VVWESVLKCSSPLAKLKFMSKFAAFERIVQFSKRLLPNIEPAVLVMFAIGTISLWGFIKIADEVFENETESFDRWAITAFRNPENPADPIGPPWVEEMARDVSSLGGFAWITFATLTVAIYLWLDGKSHMALFLGAATASGGGMSMLLKSVYARPRPDLVPHLSQVFTSSFPSGHSMLAAVVYLTLGSLLASVISKLTLKIYVLFVAVMLTCAVGLTRVYLGVHYPTDVLAGWLAGLAWALLCWSIARMLQIQGKVERAGEDKGST
jgi:undecaprenyl-diphosphatase